ncbi:MAG: serine endoprotease DegQ, partial [Gammaproteobacteria bacterium]
MIFIFKRTAAVLAGLMFFQFALATLPLSLGGQEVPSLAPLVREASPAVVSIATKGTVRAPRNPLMDDPFFQRFF